MYHFLHRRPGADLLDQRELPYKYPKVRTNSNRNVMYEVHVRVQMKMCKGLRVQSVTLGRYALGRYTQ